MSQSPGFGICCTFQYTHSSNCIFIKHSTSISWDKNRTETYWYTISEMLVILRMRTIQMLVHVLNLTMTHNSLSGLWPCSQWYLQIWVTYPLIKFYHTALQLICIDNIVPILSFDTCTWSHADAVAIGQSISAGMWPHQDHWPLFNQLLHLFGQSEHMIK